MDWIKRLNNAIDYIEEHLTEEIDFESVARVALCSSYHFQRMFSYMAEMTISEYIRRRRMSRAAVDLISGDKVIDVALKYGYGSPTAFNRAFKTIYNVSPSEMKNSQKVIKSFTPIRFAITIKGAEEMEFKLVKKDAFKVVGITENIQHDMEKNFAIIPAMWDKACKDGTINTLYENMKGEPAALLGISICNEPQWRYAIAVPNDDKIVDKLTEITIPEATWAIFYGEGTNKSIQKLMMRVHTEWLPSSGYEFGNAPEIEVYYSADPNNAKYEIWLPVIPKA